MLDNHATVDLHNNILTVVKNSPAERPKGDASNFSSQLLGCECVSKLMLVDFAYGIDTNQDS